MSILFFAMVYVSLVFKCDKALLQSFEHFYIRIENGIDLKLLDTLWNEKLKKWHFERKIKWSFPNKEDFYEYSTLFARVLLMSSLCLNVSKRYYKVLNVSKFKQSIKWVKNCYLFDTFLAETKLWQTISTSHFFERKLAKEGQKCCFSLSLS